MKIKLKPKASYTIKGISINPKAADVIKTIVMQNTRLQASDYPPKMGRAS